MKLLGLEPLGKKKIGDSLRNYRNGMWMRLKQHFGPGGNAIGNLGKLIAAEILSRPLDDMLSLLPESISKAPAAR